VPAQIRVIWLPCDDQRVGRACPGLPLREYHLAMSSSYPLMALLPVDIVDSLEVEGAAVRIPQARTGGIDAVAIAVSALQMSSVLVTLAQSPSVLEDLARRLHLWSAARGEQKERAVITLSVRGPKGRAELELTRDTPADKVAEVLRLVLDDSPPSPEVEQ